AVGNTVMLWDLSGEKPRQGATLKAGEGIDEKVNVICFAPDGKTLAWANHAGAVLLWDLGGKDPERRGRVTLGPDKRALALAFTADGRALAAAARDEVVLWDMGAGKISTRMKLSGQHRDIEDMTFARGGKALASFGNDGAQDRKYKLRSWDLSGDTPKEKL